MKISTRISFIFTIFSSMVLLLFGASVYIYTKNYIESDFFERLKNRVEITENFFLEKETFTGEEFEKIKEQFLHTLNEEKEEVIEVTDSPVIFKNYYSDEIKRKILNNNHFEFKDNDRQGASKFFNVDNKKYLIIVTANNKQGNKSLYFLRNRILFLILISVPTLFFLSIFIAKRTLLPISKKIKKANEISANNLHERLKVVNPKDELGQMGVAFNNLLDRLEKSFQAQKTFVSNASHEIKNPLTAIIGEAEIASSKERTASEYLESFSVILSEAERLSVTVNNLLQLSKINTIETSIEFTSLNFSNFIITLIDTYKFLNSEHKLVFETTNNEIFINANKNLLKTAIDNIFDNACKFSNNQTVHVTLISNTKTCALIVKDYGIGIPQKDIENITNTFYRASNTISIKGSGIGLALSKKIIKLHNGTLKIKSVEKEGTTVIINLPLSKLLS